jgi:predicted anti-sigma-YlaC factor YlaD
MGLVQAHTRHRCDRIREWISLELDGELSRIERALVDRHLAVCGDCTAFAAEVRGFTQALRGESLEPLARPIELPSSKSRLSVRPLQVAAAAAVALIAVGIGSLSSSLLDGRVGSGLTPSAGLRVDEGKDQLRARQMRELAERIAQVSPRPVGTQPV